MPRGTKKNANQHNNKHENGIVAPGRRIAKQRSNGHLRDAANTVLSQRDINTSSNSDTSSTRANSPPPPSPPPGLLTEQRVNPPALSNGRLGLPSKAPSSTASHAQPAAANSLPGDGKGEDNMSAMDGGKAKQADGQARRPEVTTVRSTPAPEVGINQHVTTLVTSRSLVDSLAVLICLLSLPPWLHIAVNTLFTLATFVPPSGSFSSLPTFSDFVSSFSPTTPSFAVIVLIDSMAMGLWQFLPNAFQALLIDSAQAVVATTLGGGYSSKPGAPDNTLWCLGFATSSHFITRYKRSIYRILHRTWIGRWTPQFDTIEERSLAQDYPIGYDRGWFDTIQVFLALHIVCQGLTKMVRRSLYTSRLSTSTFPGGIRDSEVTSAGATGVDVGEGVENTRHGAQLRSKESLANLRDVNRDKISSGKRRRKQGNYTRSQQPLWAAFASTKALMAREYLTKDAKADKKDTGSVDNSNLGDSPFESTKNKVWITRTHPNSVFFETGPMEPSRAGSSREGADTGIDRSKPFFVRVNRADWISMKMAVVPETEDKGKAQWVGEVYGLSPTYSYEIHFIRSDDNTDLHSEIIVTPAASLSDQTSAAVAAPQPILPSSPASPSATLKVSIAGCEASITDLQEKLKKHRKESRQQHTSLRKEIDSYTDKLAKQAQSVQTLQARQTKERQHIGQAEDAITSMAKELDSWQEIPPEEFEEYRVCKAEHESTKRERDEGKDLLIGTKAQNQRTIHALHLEGNKEEQKNQRLQQRVTKLKAQYERLTTSEASSGPVQNGPGETQRSDSGASLTRSQRHAITVSGWENLVEGRRRMLNAKREDYDAKVAELQQLQQQAHQQAQFHEQNLQFDQPYGRPRTPSEDGQLPGTGQPLPGNARAFFDQRNNQAFGTPNRSSTTGGIFGSESFTPGSASLHKTNSTGGHGKTKPHSSSFGNPRPRSTSIMSGNTVYQDMDEGSGGTDGTAFEQLPSVPFGPPGSGFHKRRSGGFGLVREGSNGGSSGSGSPRVLGGITRPPVREPLRDPSRENSWNAA